MCLFLSIVDCCCLVLMCLIVIDSFADGMLMILRVCSLWIKTRDAAPIRNSCHMSIFTGEALVVCVVVSCPESRPLQIRPKKSSNRPLKTGDEQIEIVSKGAYSFASVCLPSISCNHILHSILPNATPMIWMGRCNSVTNIVCQKRPRICHIDSPLYFEMVKRVMLG